MRPTRRYGLRVLPGYPVPQYVGDVITYGNSSREQVEKIRRDMTATGHWHEVVELDENSLVVETAPCGHPNHGAPDHDCKPFALAEVEPVSVTA